MASEGDTVKDDLRAIVANVSRRPELYVEQGNYNDDFEEEDDEMVDYLQHEGFEDPIDSMTCNTLLPPTVLTPPTFLSSRSSTSSSPANTHLHTACASSESDFSSMERLKAIVQAVSHVELCQRVARPSYFCEKIINKKAQKMSPVCLDKVSICSSITKGVYLKANNHIEKGSVLVAIDYLFAITKEKVFHNAQDLLSNIIKEGCTDFRWQLMKVCKVCCDVQTSLSDSLPKSSKCNYVIGFGSSACVFALVAQLLRPVGQSTFEFYLKTLPDFENCKKSLPILFEDEEWRLLQRELKGTALYNSLCFWRECIEAIPKCQKLQSLLDSKWFDHQSQSSFDSLLEGTIAWEINKGKIKNFSEVFKWAVALFNSRSFTCMVPLLDLVNGSNDPNLCNVEVCKYDIGNCRTLGESNTNSQRNQEQQQQHCFVYCLVAKGVIDMDAELVLHYGNKTADLYFNQYGMHPDLFDSNNAFRNKVAYFSLNSETLFRNNQPSTKELLSLRKNVNVVLKQIIVNNILPVIDSVVDTKCVSVSSSSNNNSNCSRDSDSKEHTGEGESGASFKFTWDDIDVSTFPWHIETLRNFISVSLMFRNSSKRSKEIASGTRKCVEGEADQNVDTGDIADDTDDTDDDAWEDIIDPDIESNSELLEGSSTSTPTSYGFPPKLKSETDVYFLHRIRDNLLNRSCKEGKGAATAIGIMTISRRDFGRVIEKSSTHRLGWTDHEITSLIFEWCSLEYTKLMLRDYSSSSSISSSSDDGDGGGGSLENEVRETATDPDRSLAWFLRRLRELEAASMLDWMILLARYYRVKSSQLLRYIHPSLLSESLKSRIEAECLSKDISTKGTLQSWDSIFEGFEVKNAALLRYYRYFYATKEERESMKRSHSLFM